MIVRSFQQGANLDLIGKTLKHVAAGTPSDTFACVGDTIPTQEQDFLKGHGTAKVGEDQLQATLCGVVRRHNKLITVEGLKTRYQPQTGDVVVGRVTAIHGTAWKVDLNSRQEAALKNTSVVVAGRQQRRVNEEDELTMRDLFTEGDLVVAEVMQLKQHGDIELQTRSLKFGKLVYGQLVEVSAQLIRRQKQHFKMLEAIGVDLILGLNGLVWVSPHIPRGPDGAPLAAAAAASTTKEQREACVRVAAAIRALAALYLQVYPDSVLDTYQLSLETGVRIKDMSERPFLEVLASSEVLRRGQAAAASQASWLS